MLQSCLQCVAKKVHCENHVIFQLNRQNKNIGGLQMFCLFKLELTSMASRSYSSTAPAVWKSFPLRVSQTSNTCKTRADKRPHTWSGSRVCIQVWTLDHDSRSGLLSKVNGDFLVQGYICDKMFVKILSLSPEI